MPSIGCTTAGEFGVNPAGPSDAPAAELFRLNLLGARGIFHASVSLDRRRSEALFT
jgi:hypothetical protein